MPTVGYTPKYRIAEAAITSQSHSTFSTAIPKGKAKEYIEKHKIYYPKSRGTYESFLTGLRAKGIDV